MPIYEYQCEKCGAEFEREQSISDDPVKTCPVCRSRKVKRLISRTSFVLKGGGWYKDLYSSTGSSTGSGDSDSSSGSGDESSDTSGGSKESKKADAGKGDAKTSKGGSKKSGTKGSGSGSAAA